MKIKTCACLVLAGWLMLACYTQSAQPNVVLDAALDAGQNTALDATHQMDTEEPDASLDGGFEDMSLTAPMLPDWTARQSLDAPAEMGINIQPALAFDGNRSLWLAYAHLSETKNQILAQRYEVDGTLSVAPVVLVEDAVGIHNEPAICALANGGIVVVWSVDTRSNEGPNLQIRFRIINADGMPIGESATIIRTEVTGNHWLGSVACDDEGHFMVVGSRAEENNTFGVFGQVFDSEGRAVNAAQPINTNPTGGQVYPVAAFVSYESTSGYLVAYEDQQGQSSRIKARFTNRIGEGEGAPFFVSAEGVSATQPAIASLPGESIVLVAATIDNQQIGLFYTNTQDGAVQYRSGSAGGLNVQVAVARHPRRDVFVYLGGVNIDAQLILGQHELDRGLEPTTVVFEGNFPPYPTSIAVAEERAAVAVTERLDRNTMVPRVMVWGN